MTISVGSNNTRDNSENEKKKTKYKKKMNSKGSNRNNRGGGSGRGSGRGGRTGGRQTGGRSGGSGGRGQQQQSQSRQQNYSTVNKSGENLSNRYTKSWNRLNKFFYLHTNNNYSFILSRVPISIQQQQQQQLFQQQNYSISNTDSANTNTKTDPNNIIHHVLAESLLDTTATRTNTNSTKDTTESKYTFYGCDEPVTWDSVRIVKYLSSVSLSTISDYESQTDTIVHSRCPICLDTYKCARITKCGHIYCLHCWIRYLFYTTPSSSSGPMIPIVSSSTSSTSSKSSKVTSTTTTSSSWKSSKVSSSKVTSTTYTSSKNSYLFYAAKCPCCTQLVHFNDLKPIRFVTINTIPTNITTTTSTAAASSTGSNINTTTTTTTTTTTSSKKHFMKFVKLHRKKNCSAPYIPVYNQPMYCHPSSIPCDSTINSTTSSKNNVIDTSYKYCRFNYIDYDNYLQLLNDNINEIQQHRVTELITLPYDDYHNNIIIYLNITIDIIQREINNYINNEMYNDQLIRQYYETTESGMYQKQFQMLFSNDNNTNYNNNQYSGTMYIQDEENEILFYQSEDGTLCFLSPFNIKCLKEEFSTIAPVQSSDSTSSSTLGRGPLPDVIEGRVIDVETIQLTSHIRERYRFLSHIPIHTTIVLIELDINHILSTRTMYTLRSEFDKRKQYRIQRITKEKRHIEQQQRQEQQQGERLKNEASNFNTFFQSTIPDTAATSSNYYNIDDEDDDLIHILPYLM